MEMNIIRSKELDMRKEAHFLLKELPERSSLSFRRQGSSGRIWNDHFQLSEPKAGGLHATAVSEKTQENNIHSKEIASPHPSKSSFSFRRQGSSGRIWDDHFQLSEPKAGGLHATAVSEKTQENNIHSKEIASPHPSKSSFSFRRQGSSGRIWDDHFQFSEPKAGGLHATAVSEKTQENNIHNKKIASPHPSNASPSSESANKVHPSVTSPPTISENEVQRCAFPAVFRRCVGSSAS
ncbi:hypothetical protein F0562_004707 [Nyssa sinensis]|uniref:Uncharacterized protein n=1 Tax=Nyssa sinensis TaxID=561372 RepID=A0A5J5C255_9ASTE|nr:hypothetical protein F0562_004707 [Nyssa sinensis]